ncbi:PAS domain S-box protein [Halalkalicoccus sp. GCM10025322]|uniref:PAS domain S-box protein n=1 Tax=Halalkalicoccus TaxID=332246 RepID=UPI002F964248
MSTLRDGTGGPASTMRVLALDEEAAAVLEGFGYVTVVPTVEAALEELTDGRFDGLLIDASDSEGVGRLERIRDGGTSVPTVAFCGSDAAARTALDAGATDVVRIDSDAEGTLVGELAAVLERRDRDEADRHEEIADLSRRALEGASPAALLERATALVADALGVDSCGAFELTPAGTLVLREGVGWEPEAIGDLTIEADERSQAGRALRSAEPVVADLGTEARFGRTEPHVSRGAESGISVVVGSVESPWGVLGAHATDRRTFTESDVSFVRSVADVLGGAVDRERPFDTELEEVYGRVTDAFFGLDEEWRFTFLNERAEELINPVDADLVGEEIWKAYPEAEGTKFEDEYRRAMDEQTAVTFEEYYPEPLDAWFEVSAYPSETGLSVYFCDVSEQRRLESELEEVFSRITDAFYALDTEWQFTHVNDRAEQLIDYESEGLEGKQIWETFEYAADSVVREEYEEAMATQEPSSFEFYYPEPLDGWFEINAYPSETGLSVYFDEITERKEHERELELFRGLLDRATDAIYVNDPETGEFLDVNETATRHLDYAREELLGMSVPDIDERVPDRQAWRSLVEEIRAEGRLTVDSVHRREDGSTFPAEVNASYIELEGGREYVVAVGRDVTERKERERALREERDLVERIVGTSPIGIVTLDADGEFDLVNDRAEEILGYPGDLEGFAGSTDAFDPVRPDGESLTLEETPTHRVLVEGETFYDVEMGLRPPGRDRVWLSVSGAPLYDGDGTTAGGVITFADVTERTLATTELRRRIDQQAAAARIGQLALGTDDLDAIFLEASEVVASVLDNEYCKVLDLDAGRRELLLRQGVGWRDGIAGSATVAADDNSQAGYTLLSEKPVIVDDLDAETRFSGPELLTSHDVVSGISVIIGPPENPWGILGTHDTERREFTAYDADFVQSVANVLANAIDRIGRERELERYETIVETVNDGIYVIDEANRFTTVNETYASMLGYDREELVGEHASLVVDDAVIDSAQEIERAMRSGEVETPSLEATLRGRNGERFEVEATFALLSDGDGNHERVGVVRDITERKRIERDLRLSAETLHELYEFTSAPELPFEEKLGRVLEAGCKRLGLEYGIFTRIEDDTMTIVQSHADHELLQPDASCPLSRSYCRRVLEEEGLVVADDALEEGWDGDPGYETFELGTYVGGQVVVDGEVYGTICFASSQPRGEPISEIERTFVELVNGWASYELERTENHQELERQREQLASLDQLNGAIRDITHGILETTSREEIETAVCERLADRYRFAWIGGIERGTNAVTPTAAAGVEEGYLDGIEIAIDDDEPSGRGPTGEAIRRREPQFRTNVLEDPDYEPWHETARERGYRSSAAIPIQHEGSLYGVLNVYSACPEAFGESERDVLTHLGEIVGHTVYAVEQRKALTSDTVLELEFRLNDVDHPLIEASSEEGVEITVERLVPGSEGAMIQFVTVTGMDATEFVEAMERYESVERATLLNEDGDGTLFEVRTSSSPLTDALSGFGGRIANVLVTAREVRVIAELPPDVDVRAVVEAVEATSGGAELLAQRTENRDEATRQELQDALVDRLTEKQRAALETAYFGGYFDWPRDHTGEEIAELLGLSPATLAQHLRIAERKLFEALFDGE